MQPILVVHPSEVRDAPGRQSRANHQPERPAQAATPPRSITKTAGLRPHPRREAATAVATPKMHATICSEFATSDPVREVPRIRIPHTSSPTINNANMGIFPPIRSAPDSLHREVHVNSRSESLAEHCLPLASLPQS